MSKENTKNTMNFDGVEEPQNKPKTSFKRVEKGAQVLTITSVEEGNSASGTPYMEVEFTSERFDASFKHKFFTTPGAMPRIQSLVIGFTGSKLTGNVDVTTIATLLVGQSSNCIVDARAVTKEVNGKVYTNEYADLRFAAFANKTTPFQDSDARVKDESAPASVTTAVLADLNTEEDDLPW